MLKWHHLLKVEEKKNEVVKKEKENNLSLKVKFSLVKFLQIFVNAFKAFDNNFEDNLYSCFMASKTIIIASVSIF